MPQFDISSFNVQLFWVFLSFFSFYFIFSWKYLPYSAFLLKSRKKSSKFDISKGLTFDIYSIYNSLKSKCDNPEYFFVNNKTYKI